MLFIHLFTNLYNILIVNILKLSFIIFHFLIILLESDTFIYLIILEIHWLRPAISISVYLNFFFINNLMMLYFLLINSYWLIIFKTHLFFIFINREINWIL